MNILILSCSTGGGHNSAARAVSEELIHRGHSVTFMDPYQLAGKNTAEYVGKAYTKLVQKSPQLFGTVYNLGEAYRQLPIHSPVYWANGKLAVYLKQFLDKHNFDTIVMSHMYPAHILAHLKQNNVTIPKTILIATDYTCIPFMEETECDYYIIPSPELLEEFISKGIPRTKLLPFGIPVKKEFTIPFTKETAKQKLHLHPDKSYILLSGGSIGAGKIEITIHTLLKYQQNNTNCSLIVVCGNNKKLYHHLNGMYSTYKNISLIQNTTHMADYMRACDIFITKPGGLSSTEAAISGTPLIHITPIPGCETHNVNFFTRRGMSIFVDNPETELFHALQQLQENKILQHMKHAQKKYINPQAASTLCDFIVNGTIHF